jgi:hypothetical protein
MGWLWAKPSVIREFAKSDERDKEKQALIDTLLAGQKEVLPLLMEVDKRLIPLMEGMQNALTRTAALLDRVEREWEWRERRTRVSEEQATGRFSRDFEDRGRGGEREGPGPGDHPPGEERPR